MDSPDFLIGTTLGIFIVSGTMPLENDLLIRTETGAEIRGDKNFKTLIGNVLREPPLFCREQIIVFTRSLGLGRMI